MNTTIVDTLAQDHRIEPARKRARLVLLVPVLLVLCALIAFTFSVLVPSLSSAEVLDGRQLRLSTVTRGELVREVLAQGRVVVANSPTLFSSEPGTVELFVQAGDAVSKGQRLAAIVSPELGEQLAREKSKLTRLQVDMEQQKIQSQQQRLQQQQARVLAQVQLQAMRREKRRADLAFAKQVISELDFEKVVDDLERARVEYEQASQSLELLDSALAFYDRSLSLQSQSQDLIIQALERRIDALQIRSPVQGVVGNIQVEHQQAVAAHQPLISVVDLSAYEVEAMIPEGLAVELAAGMSAEIQLGNGFYRGTLTAISPEVVNGAVSGRIRFTGEAPPQLRQNQRLTVRIQLESKADTLRIERGSFFDNYRGHLYKLEGDYAHKVAVTLGARSLRHIEVADGLQEGDVVIVSALDGTITADILLISHR